MQANLVNLGQLPPAIPPAQPAGGQVAEIWAYRRHLFNGYWAVIGLFVVVAILAPVLAPYDPIRSDLPNRLLPPSWQHWFGTDVYGMDIYSRVLWATRHPRRRPVSRIPPGGSTPYQEDRIPPITH